MMKHVAHIPGGTAPRIAAASAALVLASALLPSPAQQAVLELPPETVAAAERWRKMAPMQSSSGLASVSGEALGNQQKAEYLRFIDDVRARLERLLDTSFDDPRYRVSVHAENSEDDRPASIEKSLAAPASGVRGLSTIRIGIVNPAKLDPRDFACELADGYLGMRVLVMTQPEAKPQSAARWFADGLAAYLEEARRQDDAEDVLSMWSGAHLAPLWSIARSSSPYASADRRIAAQLVAYWMSFPARGKRLDAMCKALASGEEWSPGLFIRTSSGLEDAIAADRDFDIWLLSRRFSVLTLGVTRREFIDRLRRKMLLYPGEDGVPQDVPPGSSPSLLAERHSEPWVAQAAAAKMASIMQVSAGRGDLLRDAAKSYGEYLAALARIDTGEGGKKSLDVAELLSKLRDAEKLLGESEEGSYKDPAEQ